MKKFIKILLLVVGIIIVLIGGALLYLNFSGLPTYTDVKRPDLKVDITSVRVERGKKIASMICAGCHLDQKTGKLTGHRLDEMPKQFGTIYSQNLTHDPTYGIGTWKDGEIAFFLRTGIHRDGRFVPPYMPKFPHMGEEDLLSVIAFLRSDDSLVAPMAVADTPCRPSILSKFLARMVFHPLEYPKAAIPVPDTADMVALGKYWHTNLGCYQCHSADFKTNDIMEPEKSKGFLAGGNELMNLEGKAVHTPNITMDKGTGIGKWTEDEFLRAIRDGFRPDNSYMHYPMERYPELTDKEIRGIYQYIHSQPAVVHNVERNDYGVQLAANASDGEKIYMKYGCNACHGLQGYGACDLREAYKKYRSNDELIVWIRNPSKIVPGTKMPTWEGVIKDAEYPSLAEYVRKLGENSHTGNVAKASALK